MMTLTEITEQIHERTGWTGVKLETAVHFSNMLLSELVGNKAASEYFESRMNETAKRIK
jgi:hypothetical protein